jgi:proteasome lid subunit RPN8/RPN11
MDQTININTMSFPEKKSLSESGSQNGLLTLNADSLIDILKDCEREFPSEACGFLFGKDQQIKEIQVVNNVHPGSQLRRFQISPSDFMKAEKHALKKELDLIGIYHSHPNHPARPSETDRVNALPGLSYVIVSVIDGKAKVISSWTLNQDRKFDFEPLELK